MAVTTPCVCAASAAVAMIVRQHVANADRPKQLSDETKRQFVEALRHLYKQAKATGRFIQMDPAKIPRCYTGEKRVHYECCADELRVNGYKGGYFSLMAKWGERQALKPRAILMQVSKAFGTLRVKVGMTLRLPILLDLTVRRPLEAAMHSMRNVGGALLFASGHSLARRGEHINAMMNGNYYCFSIDAKSFDGAQGYLTILERKVCLEHIELTYYPKEVRTAFREQDYLKIKSAGIRARVFGNRASGTGGTATGNKFVMVAILIACFDELYHTGKVQFYSDGDDTLIFIHRSVPEETARLRIKRMDEFLSPHKGCATTVEEVAFETEQVVFCRAKPVKTANGWTLVKRPIDALRTVFTLVRHFKSRGILLNYLTTLGVGYRSLFSGVPVLGVLADVFALGGTVDRRLLASGGLEYMMARDNEETLSSVVTSGARASFARAFGVSPATQKVVEQLLLTLRPYVFAVASAPLPRPRAAWPQPPDLVTFRRAIPFAN